MKWEGIPCFSVLFAQDEFIMHNGAHSSSHFLLNYPLLGFYPCGSYTRRCLLLFIMGTYTFAYRGISTTANDHTVISPTALLSFRLHQMTILSFRRGNVQLPNKLFGQLTKGQLPISKVCQKGLLDFCLIVHF